MCEQHGMCEIGHTRPSVSVEGWRAASQSWSQEQNSSDQACTASPFVHCRVMKAFKPGKNLTESRGSTNGAETNPILCTAPMQCVSTGSCSVATYLDIDHRECLFGSTIVSGNSVHCFGNIVQHQIKVDLIFLKENQATTENTD